MTTITRQLQRLEECKLPIKTITLYEICKIIDYPHHRMVIEVFSVLAGFPGLKDIATQTYTAGKCSREFETYLLQPNQAKYILQGLKNLLQFKKAKMDLKQQHIQERLGR